MPAYSVKTIRTVERYCIEQLQIDEDELMQRAAQQAWQTLCTTCPQVKRINVLAGPGNNGGDAYVLAYLAMQQGYGVCVYTATNASPATAVALRAYQRYQRAGGKNLIW